MAAEAAEGSTVAVVVEGSTVEAAEGSTVAEATAAAGTTARPVAVVMEAVDTAAPMVGAETTIRCLLAAPIPLDVPAILTAEPVIEDLRLATAATVQQGVVPA